MKLQAILGSLVEKSLIEVSDHIDYYEYKRIDASLSIITRQGENQILFPLSPSTTRNSRTFPKLCLEYLDCYFSHQITNIRRFQCFRVRWTGVSLMVGAFSLLAVGTSLIGTLLGFSEFFKEQLKNRTWHSPPTHNGNWWGRNKMSVIAVTMVVAPSLFVSTTFPHAFSAATDIAGGYCMTVLYGVLPPAMAWAMRKRKPELSGQKELSDVRPALIVVGLFACGIVVEQILQDILALQS